jgi:gamma-glutamyl:cysteine ligase YbdK (ATP-grasp superfamily)
MPAAPPVSQKPSSHGRRASTGRGRLPGAPARIAAFAGCGIELEYMIVDRDSLAIRPIAQHVLPALAHAQARGDRSGELGWSNELVRHVVEVKNVSPAPDLASLCWRFHDAVRTANAVLVHENARLMPTAMHPFMDPAAETALWDGDIYRAYDRIYGCRDHGWANLQAMHVNLPFADDTEFERLHAAIRLVLPLLPALAASSPIAEGSATGYLDSRLDAYRRICAITPSVAGAIVPETVATRAEYEAKILAPMYAEIAPHDPAGVLRHEWLNSRGAIARFDRNAIEIRVVDMQECPQVDAAIAAATASVVKTLYAERFAPLDAQQAIGTEVLVDVLSRTIRDADRAIVDDRDFLRAVGIAQPRVSAGEAWSSLVDVPEHEGAWWRPAIDLILREGPLARRIVRASGGAAPDRLHAVYGALCDCLDAGRMLA